MIHLVDIHGNIYSTDHPSQIRTSWMAYLITFFGLFLAVRFWTFASLHLHPFSAAAEPVAPALHAIALEMQMMSLPYVQDPQDVSLSFCLGKHYYKSNQLASSMIARVRLTIITLGDTILDSSALRKI